MEEEQLNYQQEPKKNIFVYFLVAFFAVFIGTGLFLIFNNSQAKLPKTQVIEESNTMYTEPTTDSSQPTEGSLSLQSDLVENKVALSTQFGIDLVADSSGKNIVGYDVVLSYDPLAFEFDRAESSIMDYKIYSYKKDNYLTFTATKNLQSLATPFSKSKIARLFFKPVKEGRYEFVLKSSLGNEKTDFITEQTEILNPSLGNLKIEVTK